MRAKTTLLAGVLSAMAVGCVGTERSATEPVRPPSSFSEAGTAQVPDRWWTAFGSAPLDAAIDTALASNFDLRTAWERLRAAEAVTDRTSAFLWPAVDASADASTTEPADAPGGGDSFRMDVAASYEVDLWGRIGSRAEAERLRAEATRADYRAAALSLSAEVARVWSRLAEARSQVDLVDRQIRTNETVLELLENRFGSGQVEAVDLLRQRQLLEATREQRTLALERQELLEHQLAVLLGRTPQRGPGFEPATLPELPPLPDAGVPAELIRRRPDVRSAFLRLRAADRDLASAISDRYPRLTLFASTATEAESPGNLFEDWLRTLGGNLLAPLFYGGELQAEVDRTEAVRQQRLFEYGQATLTAYREVEDALARETRQRERVARIRTQVSLAGQAYEQLRVRYLNGTSDYLDVLTALDQVQQLNRDLLGARLALVEARISLYAALAGSFVTGREADDGREGNTDG